MVLSIAGILQSFLPTFDRFGKASIIFAPIINTNPSPPPPAPPSSSGSSSSGGGGGAGVGSISIIPIYEPPTSPTTTTTPVTPKPSASSASKSTPTIATAQQIKDAVIAAIGTDISDWGEYSAIGNIVTGSVGSVDSTASTSGGGDSSTGAAGGGGGLNTILPTVRLNKSKVQWGDVVQISGISYPKNPVTIIVRSGSIVSVQTKTQKNGIYRYYLDTSLLEPGVYLVQTRSEKDGVSSTDNFVVGTKNVVSGSGTATAGTGRDPSLLGDLNDDSQINIEDLSILLYWNEKTLPEELRLKMGIKADEIIDTQHFSILVKKWTG